MLHGIWKAAVSGALVAACGLSGEAAAAPPTAEQALKLAPLQAGIDYDQPKPAEIAQCTLVPLAQGGSGWEVRGPNQETLRRFADTNGDNKVDIWCYFKTGIEVYRDIDTNQNAKADQYRWFGTAGTRWGLDTDEDGVIDSWRTISAEESTFELVEALRTRDAVRFKRLLLTDAELAGLGLAADRKQELATRLAEATAKFKEFAETQKVVTKDSLWLHFAASPPGTVAAGTDGSTKDITAYENVSAMVETAGKHGQVQVGTLVQVAGGWRAIDLPRMLDTNSTEATGFFFLASRGVTRPEQPMGDMPGTITADEQALSTKLNDVEKRFIAADPTKLAPLYAEKADLMQKLAIATKSAEMQATWIRQLADTVAGGVQSGQFPGGAARLKPVLESLVKQQPGGELAGYVKFRHMSCEYHDQLQATGADIAKVQAEWLKQLEAYVEEYPKSTDAAEAMLQLALAQEFAGQDVEAKKWYGKITTDFPEATLAKKATGAVARLESVGKPLALKGTTLDGRPVDIAAYQGKIVLIHYWATWCGPCKEDMAAIKKLLSVHGGKGFAAIGVNLDNEKQPAAAYSATNKLPWPQLFEEGGLDSRLANELGVLTLPTMLLVDQAGRVIDRNANLGEVEKELQKRLK